MSLSPAWFGKYSVASTNLRLMPDLEHASGEEIHTSLTAQTDYIYHHLQFPESSFHFQLKVPSLESLFPVSQGQSLDYCGVVYYPVNKQQKVSSYGFHPQGFKLPLMLQPDQIPEPCVRNLPLIILSHGYESEFMVHSTLIRILVSQGYIVAALFHGDRRLGSDDFNMRDESSPIRMEKLLLRGLSLRKALDTIQSGPFKPYIDWHKVGGLGVSFGGTSLMLSSGAPLDVPDYDPGLFIDRRVTCVGAMVPYMGSSSFRLWQEQSPQWQEITTRWLALCGSSDTMAPIQQTRETLQHLPQDTYLVSLEGEPHFMSAGALRVVDTWLLEFFNKTMYTLQDSLFSNGMSVSSKVSNRLELING